MVAKTQLNVGGTRNVHGTRISKRIKCQKCGLEDHITSRPSRTQGAFCRACALITMNALEVGKKPARNMKEHVCSNCRQNFALPVHIEIKKDSLCPACLHGHETWRGSLSMPVEARENMTCELRKPGVLLRKSI
ncbi:MAG: hypothetical protein WCK42_05125 [Myxococcaceae bacterium]